MKPFVLQRDIDESGISGTGIVAEGIEFSDGRCTMAWRPLPGSGFRGSIATYDNIHELRAIHGHQGRTRVVYLDEITGAYNKMVNALRQAAHGVGFVA
jgi:hypothetical protein